MAKILIVEDELQWSILEEDALKKAGHEVVCTIAANEAWDLLEIAREGGKPFKLAVIDLVRIPRVPEGRAIKGEGLRLLKKLRSSKQYAKLPIVCTTVWLQSDSVCPRGNQLRGMLALMSFLSNLLISTNSLRSWGNSCERTAGRTSDYEPKP